MGEGKKGLSVGRGRLVVGQLGRDRSLSDCVRAAKLPEGGPTGEGKFGF